MSVGQAAPPLLILGAGPVGLLAAIRARQLGLEVEIRSDHLPSRTDHPRLEVVPAQVLALLVEFGVPPRALGVEQLRDKRFTQWQSPAVQAEAAPISAHIARPALELTLLELADRAGVRVGSCGDSSWQQQVADGLPVLDATGRSAVTAARVLRPKRPIVCRTFMHPAVLSAEQGEFAIAAGPEGYAYRLSNALHATLGVVGNGRLLRGSACEVIENIRSFAPWLVACFDPDRFNRGSTGAASIQWVEQSIAGAHPIGDAWIARDSLASQGLALGFGDALQLVSQLSMRRDIDPGFDNHRRRVLALIEASPFSAAPIWKSYLDFLGAIAISRRGVTRNEHYS